MTHRGRTPAQSAARALWVVFFGMAVSVVGCVASLDPWHAATVLGLWLLSSQVIAGLALLLVVVVIRTQLLAEVAHALEQLLLAAVLLWAYIAFAQWI